MSVLISLVLCLAISSSAVFGQRTISVTNRCPHTIWVGQSTNDDGAPLDGGIRQLDANANTVINIPDGGWKGRLWPKTGCNGEGQECKFGQAIPPCGPNGCTPPADTKVEFNFPPAQEQTDVWYDISLVDGYSLPVEIVPSQTVRFILGSYSLFVKKINGISNFFSIDQHMHCNKLPFSVG